MPRDKQKSVAFIFPGQGEQKAGMGKDLFSNFKVAREIVEQAEDVLKRNISEIMFNGPDSDLTKTVNSQVCILLHEIMVLEVIKDLYPNLKPSICAGLSLGEYGALVASNTIGVPEALLLVSRRAELMEQACDSFVGTMAAVIGSSEEVVTEAVEKVNFKEQSLWIANLNCPGQIVISGTPEGVLEGSNLIKENGGRIVPLNVAGAFHSGLMRQAQDLFAQSSQLDNLKYFEDIKLVMNVTGKIVDNVIDIKQNLIKQITHSVLWNRCVEQIVDNGVDLFIEIGPGKTLRGMNKRIGVTVPSIGSEKVADIELIAGSL